MSLHVRYQQPLENPVNEDVLVHKNNKGYHIKIGGKFYFPEGKTVEIISNLSKFEDKEFWIAIISDNVSYGKFSLAVPDYFVREDENGVYIEKEVPLNDLAKDEDIYSWDYLRIGNLASEEDSDLFIETMENKNVPENVLKEAITLFYDSYNK